MTITVSTDGSALGNPNGPMGWAWADHETGAGTRGVPGHEHPGDCDAGGATNGTNQIGELCAVLEALRAHPGTEPLVIETDSQYAINCSTKWVHGWKRNGWRNSQKKPVKNAALIKAIDQELHARAGSVKFVWVKGHAGNAGNEKVDELARTYAGDCRSKARDGYLPREGWESLLASEYARGVDVPEDARMLMDGRISDADYHLGRGEDSGESGRGSAKRRSSDGASGNHGAAKSSMKHRASDGASAAAQAKDSATAHAAAAHTGKPAKDFVDDADATRSASSASAASSAASMAATNADADDRHAPDAAASNTPHTSGGDIAETNAGTAAPSDALADENAMATRIIRQSTYPMDMLDDADEPRMAVGMATPTPPDRRAMSTVRATGRLVVSPAPSTSRAFRGASVRVRATIAVDAIIRPDGTMEIDAPMTFDRNDVHRV